VEADMGGGDRRSGPSRSSPTLEAGGLDGMVKTIPDNAMG